MMRKLLSLATVILATAAISLPASAAIINISTSDNPVRAGMDNQGWWQENVANNNPTNDNYILGVNDRYRNYFTFDLSGVTGTITGARLEVRRYGTNAGMQWNLWDVSTSAADLARRQVQDAAVYNDLGTGASYGSLVTGAGSSMDLLAVTLNATALADINAALGAYFSIGGSAVGNGQLFGSSGAEPGNSSSNFVQRLVLTTGPTAVPEPGILGLMGLGLFVLMRRNRRIAAG